MNNILKKEGPDFICIGLPKAGTTWIYSMLCKHPQVNLPDKEIRYFWEKARLGQNGFFKRMISSNWHYRSKRNLYKKRFLSHIRDSIRFQLDINRLVWDIRYAVLPRSDKWYLSLFNNNYVNGDISPIYHMLNETEVDHINKLLPHTKIIIAIRNQVEREWSRAKMILCKNRNRDLDDVSEGEYIEYFNEMLEKGLNDYVGLIEKWKKYFGDDKIFVVFYDELKEKPAFLYQKICEFLEINIPDDLETSVIRTRINKGISRDIPTKLEQYLYRMYEKTMTEQINYFKDLDYPKIWLNKFTEKYG